MLAQTAPVLARTAAEAGVVIPVGLAPLLGWLPGAVAVAKQMLLPLESAATAEVRLVWML